MGLLAIRIMIFALLLSFATVVPAFANQDHFEDVQKADLFKSDDQRMQYIGKCFRAEPSQHRRTPPLKFCSDTESYDCFFISRTEQFHVIDYVMPTDFKIQFDWGKIAYINTNEFEWGLHSPAPDRAIFECPVKKVVVKKKARVVKKVRKKCCRCCCHWHCAPCKPCNPCSPCNRCNPCSPCNPCKSGRQQAPQAQQVPPSQNAPPAQPAPNVPAPPVL